MTSDAPPPSVASEAASSVGSLASLSPKTKILKDVFAAMLKSAVRPGTSDVILAIRDSSLASLEVSAASEAVLAMQTWLDAFTRTNSGGAPAEYAAPERALLLSALDRIVAVVNTDKENNSAFNSCVGRVISLTAEEMTKIPEVVPEVQRPCCSVLVRLASSRFDQVFEAIFPKLTATSHPHFFTVFTLGEIAAAYPAHDRLKPQLKTVIGALVAAMKSVKKENAKHAFAVAIGAFADAAVDARGNNASDINLDAAHDLNHELRMRS